MYEFDNSRLHYCKKKRLFKKVESVHIVNFVSVVVFFSSPDPPSVAPNEGESLNLCVQLTEAQDGVISIGTSIISGTFSSENQLSFLYMNMYMCIHWYMVLSDPV